MSILSALSAATSFINILKILHGGIDHQEGHQRFHVFDILGARNRMRNELKT